jgi:signal transduction histidine kinase
MPAARRGSTLAGVTRREQLIDWGIALGVLGGSLGVLASGGLGIEDPSTRPLDALGVIAAAAAALPLAARRRAPLPVLALTCAAVLVQIALHYPVDLPLAQFVAIYTVADVYGGSPRRRLVIAAVAAFLPAAIGAYAISGEQLRLIPEFLGMALLVAGVWIAGDRTRLRRERIAELEERDRRREREAERERRLAAAEERTRIARELHDSAGHAINVILVQAGAARLLHERDPERSRAAIRTIEEVARGTIGEIDRLVRALREAGSEPPADPALLEELVAQHRAGGLRVMTEFSGPAHPRGALPPSVAWAAYRILQEALTNAARHGSGAADVAVRLGADAAEITVTNPAGSSSAPGGGHGIVGMRERATLLGGTLDATRQNGTFRLHARLPYEAAR